MKRVGIALSVALVVAACNGSSTDSSPTTTTSLEVPTTTIAPTTITSTTTTSTTTTTTVAPTTLPPAPSTAPPTTPQVVIPVGAPSEKEIIRIVNEWESRVVAIYADPTSGDVGSICVSDSPCMDAFGSDLASVVANQQYIEGAEPYSVNYLREVVAGDGGQLLVSYWTNPTYRGRVVSPGGSVDRGKSETGSGALLVLVPFPEDAQLPWRAHDLMLDQE